MTMYEQGFLSKCAEHGLSSAQAEVLLSKSAGRIYIRKPSRLGDMLEDIIRRIGAKTHGTDGYDNAINELFRKANGNYPWFGKRTVK